MGLIEAVIMLVVVGVLAVVAGTIAIAISFGSRLRRIEHRLSQLEHSDREATAPPAGPSPQPPRTAAEAAAATSRRGGGSPSHTQHSPTETPTQTTPSAEQPGTIEPTSEQPLSAGAEEPEPEADTRRSTFQGSGEAASQGAATASDESPAASESRAADETHAAATPPSTSSTGKSVEERLGTKVFIWIGGIALVLAGAFLVKYSFENQLMPPGVRVLLGALFGGALLGGGEFMRKRSGRIAQALTGAGVADLFACLLAARTLYELIDSTTAFILMAILTAAAVTLALRHGQFVALLGLIGGFATPPLIGSGNQQIVPLLGYLLLLEVGLMAITRRRGWVGLTGLTLLASMGWALVVMLLDISPQQRFALEAFLIGSAAVYVLGATGMTAETQPKTTSSPLGLLRIAMTALGAGVVFLGAVVAQSDFALTDFVMLGLMGAGVLVLARLKPMYGPMAWLAGAASALTLVAFAIQAVWQNAPASVELFTWLVFAFGLLYSGGSYAAMWRSGWMHRWAAGSVAASFGFFMVARAGLWQVAPPAWFAWWWIGLALGLIYAGLAWPAGYGRDGSTERERALGALAVGSGLWLAVSAQMGLEYPWQLGPGAAIAALAGGLVRWQGIAGLRTLALVLAALVTIGAFVPGPAAMDHGTTRVLNALLPAYALPALGLGLGAWWLRDRRPLQFGQVLRLLALIVGAGGMFALVRQGFHPSHFLAERVGLYEWATYGVVALTAAHGLLFWDRWHSGWPQRWTGAVLAGMGILAALFGTVIAANPLITPANLGAWPGLNGLLYIYGAPVVLIALLTGAVHRCWPHEEQARRLIGGAALVLLAVLLGLEVRHGFHGPAMGGVPIGLFEWATYAVVALLAAHTFFLAERRKPGWLKRVGGLGFAGLSMAASIGGAGLLANPLWNSHAVGSWPVVNGLLYIYGLPAALTAMLGWPARWHQQTWMRVGVGLVSLALVFALVSLSVRQAFVGPVLSEAPVSMPEWYSYSLAWIVLGVILILAGIRFKSSALRYGSLAVMLLAIGKVFLLDTARLEDLYRVLSLLGLGLSLLGLGYVYQRYVFRGPPERKVVSEPRQSAEGTKHQ